MRRHRIVATGLLAAGIAAGYAFGGFFRQPGVDASARGGGALAPGLTAMATAGTTLSAEARARVDAVWRGRNPSEQIALASAWADVRDSQAIRELLHNIHRLPSHGAQTAARAVLMSNWMATDPEAALAYCRDHSARLVVPLLESWAVADPEAARAHALGNLQPGQRDEAMGVVFTALAGTDINEAFEFLDSAALQVGGSSYGLERALANAIRSGEDARSLLERANEYPPDVRRYCREAGAAVLAAQDPEGALAWWRQQPDRRELGGEVFQKIPPEHWDAAVALLADLDVDEARSLVSSVAYQWSQKDPERAFSLISEWASSGQSDTANRFAAYPGQILSQWSRKDARAAAEAYRAAGGKDAEVARNLARRFFEENASAARQWAESLADANARAAALEALDQPARSDQPVPALTAEALVARAAAGSIDYNAFRLLDPEERAGVARAVAGLPESERMPALGALLGSRDQYPYEARAAILAVPVSGEKDRESLDRHINQLAQDWARQVPEDAARWVETLPDGSARNAAARSVAQQWAHFDREGARAWSESLPEGATRDTALAAIPR